MRLIYSMLGNVLKQGIVCFQHRIRSEAWLELCRCERISYPAKCSFEGSIYKGSFKGSVGVPLRVPMMTGCWRVLALAGNAECGSLHARPRRPKPINRKRPNSNAMKHKPLVLELAGLVEQLEQVERSRRQVATCLSLEMRFMVKS